MGTSDLPRSTTADMNKANRTVLVTGATGLLGNNLVRALLDDGFLVKALVRSPEKARLQFRDLEQGPADRLQWITGDVRDPDCYRHNLEDIEAVFHTAAYFRDGFGGPKHAKVIHETNVIATRDLLDAAYQAGVPRLVHTSSTVTLKANAGVVATEDMLRPPKDGNDYYRSKVAADREIENFLGSHPMAWVCMVLPGFMVGPGDAGPTPAGKMIVDFVNRKLPGIPNAAFSVVDARDVAAVMIRAAAVGERGRRYLAGGSRMTVAEICAVLEEITGIPAPKRPIPDWMLFAVALVQEASERLTGRAALINRQTVRLMKEDRERTLFDSTKTERELDIQFRSPGESWAAAYAWLHANGYC